MKLNLGCGLKLREGWVNVDTANLPGVDIHHNLDVAPWPWDDKSVSEILAEHVFEHVFNPLTFMNEAWRVLEPGGLLCIVSPWYQHASAFTDPTHRRFCTNETWDYWVEGSVYRRPEVYGTARFAKLHTRLSLDHSAIKVDLEKLP